MDTIPLTQPPRPSYNERSPGDIRTPWTTARCNRLLRPLTSRLAALRKYKREHNTNSTSSTITSNLASQSSIANAQTFVRTGRRKSGERAKGNDPDWVPFSARKKVKRKYAGRCPGPTLPEKPQLKRPALEGRLNSQPGEICVPTPVIARHERLDEASGPSRTSHTQDVTAESRSLQLSSWHSKGPRKQQLEPKGHLQNVQRVVTETDQTLIAGLYDSFGKLLTATQCSKRAVSQTPRKGPRSLLSTCLRQVPTYIALEEYWQLEDLDNDKSDISAEVYEELEALGSAPGQGWHGLKQVVRAHGAALIAEAISENLIDYDWVDCFVRRCIGTHAYDEAEQLLAALVLVERPFQYPPNLDVPGGASPCGFALGLVNQLAEVTDRRGFYYRQLELMLRSGQMPVEWLSTRTFQFWWPWIIRDLSGRDNSYPYALELVRTVFLMSCQLVDPSHPFREHGTHNTESLSGSDEDHKPKKPLGTASPRIIGALTNTISSLMTTLATMTISSGNPEGQQDDNKVDNTLWPLESIALDILHAYPSILDNPLSLQRATTVLASLLLLRARNYTLSQPLLSVDSNTLIRAMERISNDAASDTFSPLDSIPGFVCSVARCLGRSYRSDGYLELKGLVQTLTTFNDPQTSSHSKWFMRRLALDSALEFAEHSKVPEHFAFARSIEQSIREVSAGRVAESPFKKAGASARKGGGWRWEEGISEWVTMTPAPAVSLPGQKPSILPSPVSEPEHCSPMVIIHRRLLGFGKEAAHDTPCKPSLSSLLLKGQALDATFSPIATTPDPQPRKPKRVLSLEDTDAVPRSKRTRSTATERLADITNTFSSETDSGSFVRARIRKLTRKSHASAKVDDEDELSMNELRFGGARSQAGGRRSHGLPRKRRSLRRSLSAPVVLGLEESEDELSFG